MTYCETLSCGRFTILQRITYTNAAAKIPCANGIPTGISLMTAYPMIQATIPNQLNPSHGLNISAFPLFTIQ